MESRCSLCGKEVSTWWEMKEGPVCGECLMHQEYHRVEELHEAYHRKRREEEAGFPQSTRK